jgi:hypothetical protein
MAINSECAFGSHLQPAACGLVRRRQRCWECCILIGRGVVRSNCNWLTAPFLP